MKTKIAKIGKFYYLIIQGDLPAQYRFSDRVGLNPVEDGVVLKAHKKARFGWPEQFTAAIEAGHLPDDETLEGFADEAPDIEP